MAAFWRPRLDFGDQRQVRHQPETEREGTTARVDHRIAECGSTSRNTNNQSATGEYFQQRVPQWRVFQHRPQMQRLITDEVDRSRGARDLGRAGFHGLATTQHHQRLDLDVKSFVCGTPSIADIALFPHLTATRSFGVGHDPARHPRVHDWLKRLRSMPIFAADLERTRTFLTTFVNADAHERKKIFWRGDRLEWVLARGFHAWLEKEIAEDRVIWPGLGVPGPA